MNTWFSFVPNQMRLQFFILLFCLLLKNVCAQTDSLQKDPVCFSIAPHYGFVVPHTSSITHLIQGHSYGAYAGVYKQVSGKRQWHYEYNLPEQGWGFSYIYTGNPKQLGNQYALMYFLDLPLNHKNEGLVIAAQNKRYNHWLGLGLGLGYSSKDWDLESNHQAAVLGSKVNISLNLQYSALLLKIADSELRAGLRISHFSNGAFQLPNLGTNNAGVFLSYHHGKKNKLISNPNHQFLKEYVFTVAGLFGLKEIPPPYGKKFGVGVFNALVERRVSYKSSIGIGEDVFYNSSLMTLMQRQKTDKVIPSDALQVGLLLSYGLHFDDFELKMQQGIYVRDNWKVDGLFYHRFGLRYKITKHVFAQLTLKTHFAKADYGELGMGYRF